MTYQNNPSEHHVATRGKQLEVLRAPLLKHPQPHHGQVRWHDTISSYLPWCVPVASAKLTTRWKEFHFPPLISWLLDEHFEFECLPKRSEVRGFQMARQMVVASLYNRGASNDWQEGKHETPKHDMRSNSQYPKQIKNNKQIAVENAAWHVDSGTCQIQAFFNPSNAIPTQYQPPAKLPRDETTSAAVRELDFSAASEPSMLKALEERRRNGALEPTEPFSSCRSQGHGDMEIQGFDMEGWWKCFEGHGTWFVQVSKVSGVVAQSNLVVLVHGR